MTPRFLTTCSIAIVVAMLGPSAPGARADATHDPVQRFQQAIDDYVALHRAVESNMPALAPSDDAAMIHQAMEARAAPIRSARSDARMSDLFTTEVGGIFRMRIRRALAASGYGPKDLLGEMYQGSGWEPPLVNGNFSWTTATATPPCVLSMLPELPEDLQYRFVGRDLVLVDIEANLIVDVLREALEQVLPSLNTD